MADLTSEQQRAAIKQLAEFAAVAYDAVMGHTNDREAAQAIALHVANIVTPIAVAELQRALAAEPRNRLALAS